MIASHADVSACDAMLVNPSRATTRSSTVAVAAGEVSDIDAIAAALRRRAR
jgi:hypothetical protein